MKITARYAALMNVLFPGLGHLYIGDYARGMILFTAFALLLFFPLTRFCIPLLAAFSGWEAYRAAGGQKEEHFIQSLEEEGQSLKFASSKFRTPLYFSVALIGAVCWLLSVFPYSGTWGQEKKAEEQSMQIATLVRACEALRGVFPATLGECLSPEQMALLSRDPWGNLYYFETIDGGFEIRSAGADGQAHSDDDLVFVY